MARIADLERYAAYQLLQDLQQDGLRSEALRRHTETSPLPPALNVQTLDDAADMTEELFALYYVNQLTRQERILHTELMNARLDLDDIRNRYVQIQERQRFLRRHQTQDRRTRLRKCQLVRQQNSQLMELQGNLEQCISSCLRLSSINL